MKIFKKNKVRLSELINESIDNLKEIYNKKDRQFGPASPFGQLLHVLEELSQLQLFYLEDAFTELIQGEAIQPESIWGLSSLSGHNPGRAVSASGELLINYNGVGFDVGEGSEIILPNLTKMRCLSNGKIYVIFLNGDDLKISLNSIVQIPVIIKQGEIESQIFQGTGGQLQSFNVPMKNGSFISQHDVNIYVNSVKWKLYDSLWDMPRGGNGYLCKTGVNGGLDIFFGNDNVGTKPAEGSIIEVEYLVTNGEGGNLSFEKGDNPLMTFEDVGYDRFGNEIDLNNVLNMVINIPIKFGSDAETPFLTTLLAPKQSRSFVLANPVNYITWLEKFNYFSVIDAYTLENDDNIKDDNVVYLFLVPDINKKLQSNENYFTTDIKNFKLEEYEIDKILDSIEESGSKILTTETEIVTSEINKYVLNISLYIFEDEREIEIKKQVVEKLSEYYLSIRRRDVLPKSDLISIIENINGVDSVNIYIISEETEKAFMQFGTDENDDNSLTDENDINISSKDILPLIRGGWSDRNGIYYFDGIDYEKPCSININIKGIRKRTYNDRFNKYNLDNIR